MWFWMFLTCSLGPRGSAICVYNATRSLPRDNNNGIFDIFNRDYLEITQDNGMCLCSRIKTVPNLNPFNVRMWLLQYLFNLCFR